ncbi:MAG: hypothetical protein JXB49_16165 [Bacteroidales bacterium]|nr:hypothetical protein [Bacteroidales bacterium]
MIHKKVYLIVFIIVIIFPSSLLAQRKRGAQYAIVGDIGLIGGAGISVFNNAAIKRDQFISYEKLDPDYSFGALASLSFVGAQPAFTLFTVSGEVISNTAIQFLNEIDTDGEGSLYYDKTINYNTIDLLGLGKITCFFGDNADKPVYFEGGLKISSLKRVKESNTIDDANFYSNTDGYDPSQKFKESYQSLVFGIGRYGDYVSVGLRFSYALDDITNGTDFMINDGLYNNTAINPNYLANYNDYSETNQFSIEFHLALTLSIFELGKASCGSMFLRPFPCYKNCEYYW